MALDLKSIPLILWVSPLGVSLPDGSEAWTVFRWIQDSLYPTAALGFTDIPRKRHCCLPFYKASWSSRGA